MRSCPQALVEIYVQPYVQAESEGEHIYYGHGLWITHDLGRISQTAIVGSDAGVSFKSSVYHAEELLVTVISNTTGSAWPVLRDIDTALQAERMR